MLVSFRQTCVAQNVFRKRWVFGIRVENYRNRMYYVYLLLSENDGRYYTGSKNDLKRMLHKQNTGNVQSTKHRRPLKLIYY
jgi:hypothetical protein